MLRTVVVDANVLIHLGQVGRLDLLGALQDTQFVVPESVMAELLKPESRDPVESALRHGWLREVRLESKDEMDRYKELLESGPIGEGEAECLALAEARNWTLASDDFGRAFRRRLEPLRIARRTTKTIEIVTVAIRAGLLTVAEADQFLVTWTAKDFHVTLRSFQDLA